MPNNFEVIRAFVDGNEREGGNLAARWEFTHERSLVLYSYAMPIARWSKKHILMVPREELPSVTTKRHQRLLLVETPDRWVIPSPELTWGSAYDYLDNIANPTDYERAMRKIVIEELS